MRDLPGGRLTLLFTDIEASTELVKRLGPAYAAVQDQHRRLLRAAFRARGGHEVDTQGDAFFYVFESARSAALAAADGQRALHLHEWPPGVEMRVRMGMHTGRPTPTPEGYIGLDVNRASRICGAGHGSQILVSSTTAAELQGALPEGSSLRDVGRHWLKDLPEREWIHRLVIAGLPELETAPKGQDGPELRRRIQVLEAGEAQAPAHRPLGELLGELGQALSDEDHTLRLSPTELQAIVQHAPADLAAYRLQRLAEWSQPRYRLDARFVALSLLIDQGEATSGERWIPQEQRYDDLATLVQDSPQPAFVLLGPPGSGKSTLLRQLELQTVVSALRADGEDDRGRRVPFFVSLNSYRGAGPGAPPTAPLAWLDARWRRRYPALPSLTSLLAEGRVLLLLDGLNELPHAGEADYRARLSDWRACLHEIAQGPPGNRVVFSCRSLDYSAPLSSPALRVPQVRIEPLDDRQVQRFLALYGPGMAGRVWRQLVGTPALELLRAPYFLKLLLDQVQATGEMPRGRAALFTGFVRQSLARELARENPLFAPNALLTARDCRRISRARSWRRPTELPERGALVPGLERLAYRMQQSGPAGENRQVRVDYDEALDMLDLPEGEKLLRAGLALSVLDEDLDRDEILFFHQLLQEYFAARKLARSPEPSRVASPWRAAELEPSLDETIASLDPPDPLPVLPATGWEETTRLAAVMADDPADFIRELMPFNLALAGRCAVEPELDEGLPRDLIADLRESLVRRCEDPDADLRARMDAARALGRLGDPRLPEQRVAGTRYRLPALVEIRAASPRMGTEDADAAGRADERPAHEVPVDGFRIGRFPVTNAEFACFMTAGGYEDPSWWEGEAAAAWRRGEAVMEGQKQNWRYWRRRFRADAEELLRLSAEGALSPEQSDAWQRYVSLSDEAFESVLEALFPGQRLLAPRKWDDVRFNHPSQPVVGISFFEARAYCAWLSRHCGLRFRLPTEAEWALAARGSEGRRFAWGDVFAPLRGNLGGAHVRAPSPVGVFVAGRTPEGVDDLTGNCFEWTRSLYGREDGRPDFGYPYRAGDGREDALAPADLLRVTRGGSWADAEATARAAYRYPLHPSLRHTTVGFRVVCPSASSG